MHKGHDVAYVEFKEFADTKDEIKMYKYGRVITSDEAHWNISGNSFDLLWPILFSVIEVSVALALSLL